MDYFTENPLAEKGIYEFIEHGLGVAHRYIGLGCDGIARYSDRV